MNLLLWFILTFIRAGTTFVLSPILRSIGYGLSKYISNPHHNLSSRDMSDILLTIAAMKEACVMVWGGLRGAVSLSLALLVDGNHMIGDRAREMIFLQTAGIVTLTLIINGTTSGMVSGHTQSHHSMIQDVSDR